jgi:hypothetical protein
VRLRVASRGDTSCAGSPRPRHRKPSPHQKHAFRSHEDSLAALGTFSWLCHRSDAPKGGLGQTSRQSVKPTLGPTLPQMTPRTSSQCGCTIYSAACSRVTAAEGCRNSSKSAIIVAGHAFLSPGRKTIVRFQSVLEFQSCSKEGTGVQRAPPPSATALVCCPWPPASRLALLVRARGVPASEFQDRVNASPFSCPLVVSRLVSRTLQRGGPFQQFRLSTGHPAAESRQQNRCSDVATVTSLGVLRGDATRSHRPPVSTSRGRSCFSPVPIATRFDEARWL